MECCKTCKHWNQPNQKYPWGYCADIPKGNAMISLSLVGDDEIFQGAEIVCETYQGFYCNHYEEREDG